MAKRQTHIIQSERNDNGFIQFLAIDEDGDYTWVVNPLSSNVLTINDVGEARELLDDWNHSLRARHFSFKIIKLTVETIMEYVY